MEGKEGQEGQEGQEEARGNQNDEQRDASMIADSIFSRSGAPTIEECENLSRECASRGQYLDSVAHQENAIRQVQKLFGLSSQRIRNCCNRYMVLCNSVAMRLLEKKAYPLALLLLEKADDMSLRQGPLSRHQETRLRHRSTTMNNIGCYYKSIREYGRALKYLQKASSLEARVLSKSADCDSPATTHLNICSVLSALGRHAQARDHAIVAIKMLDVEMDRVMEGGGDMVVAESRSFRLRVTALYNKGVEEMWLHQYGKAEMTYVEALDVVSDACENNDGKGGEGAAASSLRHAIEDGLKEARAMLRSKKKEKERMLKAKTDKLEFLKKSRR